MMHSEKVREFTANEFETEVLKSDLPVIVDFYSTECPPCEAVAPKFDGLAELYGDHVRFLKIFRQGNRELADQLNVRSSPTLLFFKGGKEVDERLIGAIRRAAIGASLDKLVSTEIAQRIAENQRPSTTETDLLIIGGGPAGLTAGIYAAQAKLKVMVVDLALGGGNVATTDRVEVGACRTVEDLDELRLLFLDRETAPRGPVDVRDGRDPNATELARNRRRVGGRRGARACGSHDGQCEEKGVDDLESKTQPPGGLRTRTRCDSCHG